MTSETFAFFRAYGYLAAFYFQDIFKKRILRTTQNICATTREDRKCAWCYGLLGVGIVCVGIVEVIEIFIEKIYCCSQEKPTPPSVTTL